MSIEEGTTPADSGIEYGVLKGSAGAAKQPYAHGPSLGLAYADARQRLADFVSSAQAESRELKAAIGMAAVALGLADCANITMAEAMGLMEQIGARAEKWLACCEDIGKAPSDDLVERLVADRRRRVQEQMAARGT